MEHTKGPDDLPVAEGRRPTPEPSRRRLIETTRGPMDESELELRTYNRRSVIEYYLRGELVHRSAATELTGVQAAGTAKA